MLWFLVVNVFISNSCKSQLTDPLTSWTRYTSPPLPEAASTQFAGYEASNDTIWIIGGENDRIFSYTVSSNAMEYHHELNTAIVMANAQCSAQWGESIIYIDNGILRRFLFSSIQLTSSEPANEALPHNREAPCVAAIYPDWIFATGGMTMDAEPVVSQYLQVLDNRGASPSWSLSSKYMQAGRGKHACVVHGDYLYVFGGYYTSGSTSAVRASSERIYIGGLPSLSSQWSYIAYKANSNVYFQRAISDILNNQIYLVGGRDSCCASGTASQNIQIYDPVSNAIELISSGTSRRLRSGRSSPAAILVNNTIYVFGGSDTGATAMTSWERSNILTFAPTNAPTDAPTDAPTILTFDPTHDPTSDPTKDPTIDPTQRPTKIPTKNPVTDAPTQQPTKIPTKNPVTDAPTQQPTKIPTKNPVTDAPTQQPTKIPTKNPVTDAPTEQPTNDRAEAVVTDTVTVTGTDSTNINDADAQGIDVNNVHSKYALSFPYIVTVITCILILFAVTGYIHSTYVHINDFFKVQAFFATLLQALDLLSDVFLTLHISLLIAAEPFFLILFIFSIACIVVPIMVSVLQLFHQIRKHWWHDDNIKLWLRDNSTLLYFLSVFSGSSFIAIHLLNSNLFSLNSFSMGLTNAQFRRYGTKKIYSIVLLENVPQLILQSLFLWKIGQFNEIAISSMVFSSISIIVTIASMITAKQILNSSGYAIVRFEVTGPSVVQKSYACKNRVSKIRSQISAVLGLNREKLVEVMKPTTIPNGLKLKMHIHLNHIQSRDINYKMLLNKSRQSGQLSQIIQNSWKLNAAPLCSQIDFTVQESKNRKKNTVSIKIDSDSDNIRSIARIRVCSVDSIELQPMPEVRPLHLIPTRGGGQCEDGQNELMDEEEGDDEGLANAAMTNDFEVIETVNQTAGSIIKGVAINDVNPNFVYNINDEVIMTLGQAT